MAEEIQSGKTDGISVNSLNQGGATTKSTRKISGYASAGKTVGLPNGQVVTLRPKQTRVSGKSISNDVIVTGVRVRVHPNVIDPARIVGFKPVSVSVSNRWDSTILPVSDADLSEEASQKLLAALGEAEAALAGAIAQAKRNTALLRDARLEIEMAHAIVSSSNRASGLLTEVADSGSAV